MVGEASWTVTGPVAAECEVNGEVVQSIAEAVAKTAKARSRHTVV